MTSDLPLRRPDVISQPAGQETLLYDPVADAVHALNRTAAAVWEMCDGQHTPADMAAHLCARFAIAPGRDVAADVQTALARFGQEGLLQVE